MTADRPESIARDPDPRLVDLVAACLCWAEFSSHADRNDDPVSYWQMMPEQAKRRYRNNAELIASAMMSDRYYAIVPVEPTATMLNRAMNAGRGIRSTAGARHILQEIIAGARFDLRWRSGNLEDPNQ